MDTNCEAILRKAKESTPVFPEDAGMTRYEFRRALEYLQAQGYALNVFRDGRECLLTLTARGREHVLLEV